MSLPGGEVALGPIRMPRVVAALIGATALLSIAAAVAERNGATLSAAHAILLPAMVWQGQVWRLVTWVLFELDALPLVFACLMLYWFGRDLARTWGPTRFLGIYFGTAAAAAVVTCLVALAWRQVGMVPHAGSWPVLDALIVAWGLLFPGRELRLYGFVRMTGRHIVWVTVGLTVLFALFRGAALYVPHFAAELAMFALFGPLGRLPGWWRRRRQASLAARARAFDLNDWIAKDRGRRRSVIGRALLVTSVLAGGCAGDQAPQAPIRTVVVQAGADDPAKSGGRRVRFRPPGADEPLTCNSPRLVWMTANKTNYTSYPEPGSEECIKYSGCKYQGMFSACGDQRKSLAWVKAHNIVAFFPLGDMKLHNLCLRKGDKTIEVTVYDTCGDHDCNGCCTRNKGKAEALIDLESFTNQRFGVQDGPIQWADLGIKGASCAD